VGKGEAGSDVGEAEIEAGNPNAEIGHKHDKDQERMLWQLKYVILSLPLKLESSESQGHLRW